MHGVKSARKLKYKPINVKDAIAEIKDTAELMLDLAYSSILFKERDFSEEVIELEDRMDELIFMARASIMLAARGIEEIEELTGVLQVIDSAVMISSAAVDLAKIQLDNLGLPPAFLKSIHLLEETIVSTIIPQGSKANGITVKELEDETSMNIIAIKKPKGEWIINPNDDVKVYANDKIIAKGPYQALEEFNVFIIGKHEEFPSLDELEEPKILHMIREIIIEMTVLSQLSIDLAYYSVLFNSKEIAEEVSSIEDKLEDLRADLELNVLNYAKQVENVNELRGLLRIAYSSEKVSDASKDIADIVLHGIAMHPILQYAVKESDEIITRIVIVKGSELDGKTYAESGIEVSTGMDIIAIKKSSTNKWQFHPKGDIKLEANDIIIAKGSVEDEDILKRLAGVYNE
ncbi:MAG: potassium channel protein [Candidatus Nitrosocaldaceae archaeon]|nr:MAG: potassium channel protein [Candidatus Nitrosocaldaceae archaeon]